MKEDISRRQIMKATGASVVAGAGVAANAGTAGAHYVGVPVFTNTGLNIRNGPGTNYSVIRTADENTPMKVIDGPWSSDGYTWWKYSIGGHHGHHGCYTGYAVEQYTDHSDFIYPCDGTVISTYWDTRDGGSRYHRGVDIQNDYGTSIKAAASGTIRQINDQGNTGCGLYLEMDHAGSYITRYCHLSDTDVSVGQTVNRGDHIANMGNSGCGCVDHLHFKLMRYSDSHDSALNWPMHQDGCVRAGQGLEKNFSGISARDRSTIDFRSA